MASEKNAFHSEIKRLGVLTTVPIILLVGPAVGYWFGSWADHKLRFYPWFTLIFVVLGFVASGREVIRLLKEILKEEKKVK